jgi:glutamate transport system permease protein
MSDSLSYLYDAPGPRARRRVLAGSVASALVIAAVISAGLWQFAQHGQLDSQGWEPFSQWPIWDYMLNAYATGTLAAAGLTVAMSAPLGLVLVLLRLSPVRPVRKVIAGYIEAARTVPVLLLVYVMMFALPHYGINPGTIWKLAIPLTVAHSALFAEIIRAGIVSLPRGQEEAGLAVGLPRRQVFTAILLPQALRAVTPSLVTQLVSLLKDTSLGYVLGFFELLQAGNVLSSYNHLLIQDYLVIALIYLVPNGLLSFLASWLRRRGDSRGIPAASASRPG